MQSRQRGKKNYAKPFVPPPFDSSDEQDEHVYTLHTIIRPSTMRRYQRLISPTTIESVGTTSKCNKNYSDADDDDDARAIKA